MSARGAKEEASGLVRIYVWELPVRITHWLVALSIFVLAFTGFYLGDPFLVVPGQARFHFVTGTVKVIHFYAAIVFTLGVLSRLAWMFLGNEYARWSQFLPTSRARWKGLWHTLSFYLFLRRDPPGTIGHNPLAGGAYLAVFALCLLMIATGLAVHAPSAALASPLRAFGFLLPFFGGLQGARFLHHLGMWLLLGFFVHHLASALMMSVVERTGILESIFTGLKFVTRGAARGDPTE